MGKQKFIAKKIVEVSLFSFGSISDISILGCVAVGITGHYIHWTSRSEYVVPELFFLLIATACLITTSLLLFSCLCSIATSSIMPKTLFETMYHIVASLLYFASALYLLIHLTNKTYRDNQYVAKTAASVHVAPIQ
ncbi:hypothetical protein Hamer_G016910 [Homarus americanus]|uniref:MARVEL domain-containing protein n=1 Tax=Homarus americanus TaxID=6706 RepID=A0A8J5TJ84_HOMAM|nr:hypothetical protein Hamer_G016910 [Homarus americanus]